jgi:hypothetical protein
MLLNCCFCGFGYRLLHTGEALSNVREREKTVVLRNQVVVLSESPIELTPSSDENFEKSLLFML